MTVNYVYCILLNILVSFLIIIFIIFISFYLSIFILLFITIFIIHMECLINPRLFLVLVLMDWIYKMDDYGSHLLRLFIRHLHLILYSKLILVIYLHDLEYRIYPHVSTDKVICDLDYQKVNIQNTLHIKWLQRSKCLISIHYKVFQLTSMAMHNMDFHKL